MSAVISETEQEKKSFQDKRIIVRVWTSQMNLNVPGQTVGHISIQMPDHYLSLWPTSEGKAAGRGITDPIASEFKPNYEADLKAEKRDPELTFCFYTLDINNMVAEFKELQCENKGWSLLGYKGESCVSAAWKLLAAGGIGNLINKHEVIALSSTGSSQGSNQSATAGSKSCFWKVSGQKDKAQEASEASLLGGLYATEMAVSLLIKSPDCVSELLKIAKKNELSTNALIQELKFDGETVDESKKKKPK